MNSSITSIEIESIIKKKTKLPKTKRPGADGFTGEFFQTLGEELISILLKLVQKKKKKGTLLNSFHEICIIWIPKPDNDTTKKEITGQYH